MTRQTRWETQDFERMSWHDVHVHGFCFVEQQESPRSIDLVLDIDYILQWHLIDGAYALDVAPSPLRAGTRRRRARHAVRAQGCSFLQ